MHKKTVKQLNRLNQRFYDTVGEEFSRSRQTPWSGWQRLLPLIKRIFGQKPITVLDVGCGNARLGKFLITNLKKSLGHYVGVDNNKKLLEEARLAMDEYKRVTWLKRDIIEDGLGRIFPDRKFDLIACFGVMHHVPGYENRVRLVRELTSLLTKKGVLVVTGWQFINLKNNPSTRLWTSRLQYEKDQKQISIDLGLESDDLEAGDYFLGWGKKSGVYRYCHLIDKTEGQKIIQDGGLTMMKMFYADGRDGKGNLYLISSKR